MKPLLLWSDALIYLLVVVLCLFFLRLRNDPQTREHWRQVFSTRLGMVTMTLILVYVGIALLDSLHFRRALEPIAGSPAGEVFYDNKVTSVLDVMLGGMGERFERTYSAPFALNSFEKQDMKNEQGQTYRDFPPLEHAGRHLAQPDDRWRDVLARSVSALLWGVLIAALVIAPQWLLLRRSPLPWSASWLTQAIVICAAVWLVSISRYYHVLGTDLGGVNVAYQSIKGIRTGVLLGTLATLIMLPIAITLGVMAGYFKGWVDDVVQYLYTTLSSIPGILLIAASVLLFQVYIDLNPDFFSVGLQKADARFLALCFILGVTSWSSLCPPDSRRDTENQPTRLRAGGACLRCESQAHTDAPYPAQCHAYYPHYLRIGFQRAGVGGSGVVLHRGRHRSKHGELGQYDQWRARGTVARADRVVDAERRIFLYVCAGAGGQPVFRPGARCI